jgi:hypothetical protein
MKILVFIVSALAAMPWSLQAGDAEGCLDLKLFPRFEGCVIQECSAKHHDPLDAGDGSGAPVDSNTNALTYSCPVGNLPKMERDFDSQLRKAGYQDINLDKSDDASPTLTARKGSQWIHWSASTEDDATAYSLTIASGAAEKFKAEACAQPALLSPLKQCEVVECNSKSEDSVAMRTARKQETSVSGNVQTVTLACPALSAAQTFSAAEGELKTSGFEILFSDREHPESAWLTGRAGKRWVELVSALDGESISYALTVVPSAEVLTASAPAPKAVEYSAPPRIPAPEAPPVRAPTPEPLPEQRTVQASPPVSLPEPVRTAPPTLPVTALAAAGFVPPVPIFQVPIEATHDRIYSVTGDVAINMLVDVDEHGSVTKAVLTGRITKDVLKLQSAALDAVSHWRFEPARQDGRIVPAVKIAVRMHFFGRPWRF